MTRDDGGQAFPVHSAVGAGKDGMTLRDWFAGKVMAAAMTNAEGLGAMDEDDRKSLFVMAAKISYEVADAMLAERNK